MTEGRTLTAAGLLALALVPSAWAGDAEPFAGFHERLSQAAEQSLADLRMDRAIAPAPVALRRDNTVDPDASLSAFAQGHWNGREDRVREALRRVQLQRASIDPILQAENVPTELLAVVLVESAGRVDALSSAGARGLWQFMPETARRYGLQVGDGRDDRLDVQRATAAAARHLRDLHQRFGSWELALAAYNAGAEAVERAIRRAGRADFAALAANRLLPAETRSYVPAVLAAAELFGDGAVLRHPPTPRAGGGAGIVLASVALQIEQYQLRDGRMSERYAPDPFPPEVWREQALS